MKLGLGCVTSGMCWVLLLATSLGIAGFSHAQSLNPYYYEVGTIDVIELYVDPERGANSNSGTSQERPLRTVTEAWRRIPSSQTLTRGYRINLLPGVYGDDEGELPNYWERKRGTRQAPIILQSLQGAGSVRLVHDINMANVSYFYLLDISIIRAGDVFHCEACDHILLRGNTLIGAPSGRSSGQAGRETIKCNQSEHIYIENNTVRGASDNAIDWVAVQYGHIVGNKISDAQSWCAYVKGGSSYVRIEANEFFDCFEGGITAGQGTGFEFMIAPWLRFEAYDIKIINNVIHDVTGAALGVNGGYNILLAHNTAFRVGSRSHLLEIVFGSRSCDGDSAACAARAVAGGWGPSSVGMTEQPIGNKQVKVLNNIFYNPLGYPLNDEHFAIYGPRIPTAAGISSPQRADDALIIRGNVIWSGSSDHPLGIDGDGHGCSSTHPTCNAALLRQENWINVFEPELRDPTNGDYRPSLTSPLFSAQPAVLEPFTLRDAGEPSPEGELINMFDRDFSGENSSSLLIGAFARFDSPIVPPSHDSGGGAVGNPSTPGAPTVDSIRLAIRRLAGRLLLTIRVKARDDGRIIRVTAALFNGRRIKLKRFRGYYAGSVRIVSRRGVGVNVVATDDDGNSVTASKSV